MNRDVPLYGDRSKDLPHTVTAAHHIVAFLAPSWADALNAVTGPDLSRTKPPIREIIADFERVYAESPYPRDRANGYPIA